MFDRRPALIARCLGAGDIAAAVAFAREHRLPLAVKGGGHNIAGLAACDGGIMLDLSPMRGVWVDPHSRTARAQAGCLIGDVDRETQLHGVAAILGFISTTGIAGLTLGGGFGYLTRRFGWTADTVRSMDVVTADGRILRASEHEHAELFWGLRGGGGNFGIVSSFEYELYPVGPQIVAGAIAWRGEDAEIVLDMLQAFIAAAPRELTCVISLRRAPPAPWLQADVHGKLVVVAVVCHSGSIAQAERDVAPLKAFGAPVGDVIQRRPYTSQQSLLDATQPKGRRNYWKSEYLPRVERDLLERALGHARKISSPHSAIVVFPIDGALNDPPPDHSPVGNRDAGAVLNIAASWEHAADDAVNIEWARSAWADLRGFSTGGNYVNFLTEDEPDERVRAAYGSHYDRLRLIKRQWDPDNLFRVNKNILPARP
jgi:FAD/FMN-containing dehydrogenase